MPRKRNPFEKPAFVEALQHIYTVEGGYVKHPKDPGGETKFGISKRSHPNVDIQNLTQEQANKIYEEDYWKHIAGEELPKKTAIAVMDNAVHSGRPKAVRNIQSIVGERRTGIMGPKTIQRVKDYAAEHGEDRLLSRLRTTRESRLSRSKARKTFGKGWKKRLNALDALTGG